MKLLAMTALGAATLFGATVLGALPAAAHDDDAFVGVRIGPIGLGLDFDDHRHYRHHRYYRHGYDGGYYGAGYRNCYDYGCGDGFYSDRSYYPRYDRRYSTEGYGGYYGYSYRLHHRHHHRGYGRGWDDDRY